MSLAPALRRLLGSGDGEAASSGKAKQMWQHLRTSLGMFGTRKDDRQHGNMTAQDQENDSYGMGSTEGGYQVYAGGGFENQMYPPVPLQFHSHRRRAGGLEDVELEDDEFADIISQALDCLQKQDYPEGGQGEEESVLTIVKEALQRLNTGDVFKEDDMDSSFNDSFDLEHNGLGTPPDGSTPPDGTTPPDGGTPPDSSPMLTSGEPRDPSYTGPIYANREGGSMPTEWSL
jgi:hypothetical protein